MIPFDFITPERQQGREEGFKIAESYVKEITKKFYKDIKKGLLMNMATTSTASSHKCNCDFCDLDKK